MKPQSSPWGKSQQINKIAPGIAFVSTAGHGGYRVAKKLAEKSFSCTKLNRAAIFSGGYYWFEEDCAWSLVAIAFPHLFESSLLVVAKGVFARFYMENLAS